MFHNSEYVLNIRRLRHADRPSGFVAPGMCGFVSNEPKGGAIGTVSCVSAGLVFLIHRPGEGLSTWDDWRRLQGVPLMALPVTAEASDHALNQMMPEEWDGGGTFLVPEAWTHIDGIPAYQGYVRHGGRDYRLVGPITRRQFRALDAAAIAGAIQAGTEAWGVP